MSRPLPATQEGRLAHAIGTYGRLADRYAARNAQRMAREVEIFAGWQRPGARVLDAGCGPGRDLARFAAAGLRPLGVDLCPQFARMAAERAAVPVLVADLRALPLPEETFDAVWACASLVHLDQEQAGRALAELRRVARPGAQAFVAVKAGRTGWRRRADMTRRWFQGWGHDELAGALEVAGWQVLGLRVTEEWADAYAVAC